MPMTPLAVYDLREAFAQPGCALCRLVARAAARYLNSVLGEYVMDDEVQARWAAGRGLCAGHAQQALALPGNALGLAVLADKVLARLLHDLEAAPAPSAGGPGWPWRAHTSAAGALAALEPAQPCPACDAQHDTETRLLALLRDDLHDAVMLAAYRASDGLCLPHTQALLHITPDAARAATILSVQRAAWGRLHAALAVFIDKNNAHHGVFTGYGDEGDSWRRALVMLGGADEVFARGRTPR